MSDLVPTAARIDWDTRRDWLESSIAQGIQRSGIDRERAYELAEQIVDGIEDFSCVQGFITSFTTPAADTEEIELKFQLSGTVKVRL